MNILISPRLDLVKDYNEIRVSIDYQWFRFLDECGFNCEILSYSQNFSFKKQLKYIQGFIISGGNTLLKYQKENKVERILSRKREKIELEILKYCIIHKVPVLGVCRGMQLIADYYGIKLNSVLNHKKNRHFNFVQNPYKQFIKSNVNSFHNFGILKSELTDQFIIFSEHFKSNTIESMKHRKLPIYGIMWHPEREKIFNKKDINLVKKIFI